MRLFTATTPHLSAGVVRPAYGRAEQKCGIVHFGIGAFHRAHQAVYTDDAMNAGDRHWAITGVSLRSPAVAAQMNPQDGLYTVTERSDAGHETRLVGAVGRVLVAQDDSAALTAAIAAPDTHIVSFTITEKGYCRRADGSLDDALTEGSVYDYLARGMQQRMAAGLPGLTLLCCDNLGGNGAQLSRLMSEYLERRAPDVLAWFERECCCPSTMVDRIVPATTDADRMAVEASVGLRDEAAVLAEPFSQWVIEDKFAGPRPRWEIGGAQFTTDVHAYEMAKLRMLNGAHSALAYVGLARGHVFVHQAVADPEIRSLVERLMRDEAAPTITPTSGQDLGVYADALLARFSNSNLAHRLSQIAMDGSEKIPQRWLETLAFHAATGSQCPAILDALGAWIVHVRGNDGTVFDPIAGDLAVLWKSESTEQIVDALFGRQGKFAAYWQASSRDVVALVKNISG